jgi:hypothetical protein
VGEAVIFAVGAGTTTGGAVGAGGVAIFFLQPATATKATSNTAGTRIRLRRPNELLLQKKREHFHDNLAIPHTSCTAANHPGTVVLNLIVHEVAMVEADALLSLETKTLSARPFAVSSMQLTR